MTLCAAIDIGSNTTRVLVAEPMDGQLKKVMEQRAYTRINKALDCAGRFRRRRSRRSARWSRRRCGWRASSGRRTIRAVATAAVREASNGEEVAAAIGEAAGVPVEVLSDEEEGRLSFIGATKTLGHPVEGKVGVVDVGGGSTEVILGTVPGGAEEVRSWRVGSGVLADELISSDPPSAAEIRKVRDRIDDIFAGVEIEHPAQAVAVGGSATSLRRLVGAVLEYETLERGIRVLCGDPAAEVARRFELDPERVRILATGVLLLEKVSELLGQPLQIGKGGLREGVVLDLLNGNINGSRRRASPPADARSSSLTVARAREVPGSTARRRSSRRGAGDRGACRGGLRALRRRARPRATSSGCTTCGWRPAACGRRWRSSSPASRASATARR